MGELSERPPWVPSTDEQLDELALELDWRRTVYARQVERGDMTRPEAELHIDLLAAIKDDLTYRFNPSTMAWTGQRHGWPAKVAELRRELAIRRRAWPRRIANLADPMSAAVAAQRMEALEAVHFRYWMGLFGSDTEYRGAWPETLTQIRAAHFRRWLWYRDALDRGGRAAFCVPPAIVRFFEQVDAGDPGKARLYALFGEAARDAMSERSEPCPQIAD